MIRTITDPVVVAGWAPSLINTILLASNGDNDFSAASVTSGRTSPPLPLSNAMNYGAGLVVVNVIFVAWTTFSRFYPHPRIRRLLQLSYCLRRSGNDFTSSTITKRNYVDHLYGSRIYHTSTVVLCSQPRCTTPDSTMHPDLKHSDIAPRLPVPSVRSLLQQDYWETWRGPILGLPSLSLARRRRRRRQFPQFLSIAFPMSPSSSQSTSAVNLSSAWIPSPSTTSSLPRCFRLHDLT